MRRPSFAVLAVAAAIAGATPTGAWAGSGHVATAAETPGDPWEGFNRGGFAINQFIDKTLVRPLAKVFHHLTPGPIGQGVHNVLSNLGEPGVLINDVLQLRPARAGESGVRLVFNSTIGVLGLFDVAGRAGVPHHPSTFGDTLGRYGVGPGPYVFLPLLGPSTVRDLFGGGVDALINPLHWVSYRSRGVIGSVIAVAGGLDLRSQTDADLQALLSDAADPYATLRSAFLQMREGEINEGLPPSALPDFGPPVAPSAPPSSPAISSAPATDSESPNSGARAQSDLPAAAAGPAEQPAAFDALPDDQRRNADDQIAGALDQR